MAGEWIKVEHVTPDKPEIKNMARALGLSKEAVVGHLMRVWIWADQQSIDGHAVSVTDDDIDETARHTGFAKSLRDVGWLTGANGALNFTNFDRHNTEPAKKRALAADRKRRERSRDGHAESVTRGEESRSRKPPISPLTLPPGITEADWQAFRQHRVKLRKPMSERAEQLAVDKLVTLVGQGYDAKKTLNHAIEAGWLTFFQRDECRVVAGVQEIAQQQECPCGKPGTVKVGGRWRCVDHVREEPRRAAA